MAVTTLSSIYQSAAVALVIAQSKMDTSTARCTPMTLQARVGVKKRRYQDDYAAVGFFLI